MIPMKHSRNQLIQMARSALEAKQAGDGRYALLLRRLSARTGLHPLQCELQICLLADSH